NSKKERLQQSINELYNMSFEIYDKPSQTIQYIRSQVRKAKKKHEGKQVIVLIDYLTLIQNAGDFYSDHAKYSDVSKKLKMIARSEEHTSELQSRFDLVCRLLLEKKKLLQ